MDTLYLWRYSHPAGGRVVTLDRFTEAEALRIFPDPERVEGSEAQAEREGHRGWSFPPGPAPAAGQPVGIVRWMAP